MKATYNIEELERYSGLKRWKIKQLLRLGKIRHIHINETHREARIPRDEFLRVCGLSSYES